MQVGVDGAINSATGKQSGTLVPMGDVAFPAPNFTNRRNFVLNFDYTQGERTQHYSRFIYDHLREVDNDATLLALFSLAPTDGRLFSYTLIHNFTPKLTNETRLAYRRYVNLTPVPNIAFPIAGFDTSHTSG